MYAALTFLCLFIWVGCAIGAFVGTMPVPAMLTLSMVSFVGMLVFFGLARKHGQFDDF